jgi:catechol 2,3-dioxygenase-like lactoylglutathione lyase family enzyme
LEKPGARAAPTFSAPFDHPLRRIAVIKQISHVNVWVDNQDEALAFYTDKVGFEVREDLTLAELGGFRWLTVGPTGQPDVALALIQIIGPPVFDADTEQQLRSLVAKGAVGAVFVATDDVRSTYEELKGRGVPFTSEPTQQPYGIDAEFQDPAGNRIRVVQRG